MAVHSTVTNRRTRAWLERVRRGETALGSALEAPSLSFLEPSKRWQNSFTLLQKRADAFEEPVYSEYA